MSVFSISECGLSDREYQILKQIAKGKLNKEIAVTLEITESTVKKHCTILFLKLGVRTRTQAAIKFLEDKP